jgi:predicted PurR-regulated permease PerM
MKDMILPRPVLFAVSLGAVALVFVALIYGKDLLIPLAVAVIIWYVLNALAQFFGRLRIAGKRPPDWLCLAAALLTLAAALAGVIDMISDNIQAVTQAAPQYQQNLQRMFSEVASLLGLERVPNLTDLAQRVDVPSIITALAGSLTNIAGNTGIIVIYVLFLLIEQRSFDRKLKALFRDAERERKTRAILGRIQADIQTYLWIKTMASLLTGVISYGILILVGVDYAAFWAFIIFLLNYIPTIGSLLATLFPALLALVQFDTVYPAIIVIAAVGALQFLIGNILEPRMMGRSLNVSPLVVLLSLALWGSIWGVVGMFLCVPITVVLMIVFANFPQTRPVAVLLSGDGELR